MINIAVGCVFTARYMSCCVQNLAIAITSGRIDRNGQCGLSSLLELVHVVLHRPLWLMPHDDRAATGTLPHNPIAVEAATTAWLLITNSP